VLIKDAVSDEAEARREISRRVTLLRSEIGRLDNKQLIFIGANPDPVETRVMQSLVRDEGATAATVGIDTQIEGTVPTSEITNPDATVAFGDYLDPARQYRSKLPTATTLYVFGPEAPAIAGFGKVQNISLERNPKQVAREKEREREQLFRVYWIVTASLLITAIGITNAMLMSVTERVREIGTLKCLGALSSFVVRLFLIESALVGLFGAIFGVLLGLIVALGGYAYLFGFARIFAALDYGMSFATILGVLAVGVILAIVSGIYPARAAAKMIPASALATNV
jgi:hypothetical protein